ncbi:MAG: restriction endonuclease [Nitrospirae bacterium]|nr:restriction endonuclease [Nitrospirota bacterium]
MNLLSIESLQALDPIEFENLIRVLFERMGFNATTTKASGDGGIDVVAINEQPIVGGKYVIQCKRYTKGNNIGEPVIRELYGVMHAENANKGILVTTSDFTKQAIAFSQDKAIELINGMYLLSLLSNYCPELGIEQSTISTISNIQNEPTGFNGIDWGTNIQNLSDMIPYEQTDWYGQYKSFDRKTDVLIIGDAKVESMLYSFFKDELYSVQVISRGWENGQALFNYLRSLHGDDFKLNEDDVWRRYKWLGGKVEINFNYGKTSNDGEIIYRYLPLWDEAKMQNEMAYQEHLQKSQFELPKKSIPSGQCFVATVVYGSPSSSEVEILRRWRDNFLARTSIGRDLIEIYYETGPSLAWFVERMPIIKGVLKVAIDIFIRVLRKRNYA